MASIRHPLHVIEAGKIGAHIVTLPPDILGKMMLHPLTEKGLATFLADWKKVKKENPELIESRFEANLLLFLAYLVIY